MKTFLLFMSISISLYASCPTFDPEYASLYQACKAIKAQQIAIRDIRINIDDAIETAVINYLTRVNTPTALVLLHDLIKNNFLLGLR